jgi:hypothetical protein
LEAQSSLVGGPVFKTGEGGEKLPWWVRFPCASAINNPYQSMLTLKPTETSGFFSFIVLHHPKEVDQIQTF